MSELTKKRKNEVTGKTAISKITLWEDERLGRPFVIASLSLLSVTLLLTLLLLG